MALEHALKEKVCRELYTYRHSTPASLRLVAVGGWLILYCRRMLSRCFIYVEPHHGGFETRGSARRLHCVPFLVKHLILQRR